MLTAGRVVYRHSALVRITHWINAISFLFLLPSGFAILLAHPEFYWGETGYFGYPPAFSLPLELNPDHSGWGRGMHFAFAWVLVVNGLVYLVSGLVSGHFRRKLVPAGAELQPAHVLEQILEHAGLRPRRPTADFQYNVLQKISYLVVVFLLFPLLLLSGLTMSPAVTAAFPELFSLFGGRQSARTIHFILASLLLLFLFVHVWQVFVTGFRNETTAMLTGRFTLNRGDS